MGRDISALHKNAAFRRHLFLHLCAVSLTLPLYARKSDLQFRSLSCMRTGRKSGTRRIRRSLRSRTGSEFLSFRYASFLCLRFLELHVIILPFQVGVKLQARQRPVPLFSSLSEIFKILDLFPRQLPVISLHQPSQANFAGGSEGDPSGRTQRACRNPDL